MIEVRNIYDLVSKMELFINLPLDNRIAMGISAREHIINNYDRKYVINQYLEIIKQIK